MRVIACERTWVDASVVVAWLFDNNDEPCEDRVLNQLEEMIRADNLSVMCYPERHIRPLAVGRVHFIPNLVDPGGFFGSAS